MRTQRIAVVGAGISGLMAAQSLQSHIAVDVFEQRHFPGGRCATFPDFSAAIDHGAQYLTCRDAKLKPHLNQWLRRGLVKPWRGPFVAAENRTLRDTDPDIDRYVACPGMDALPKALAENVPVRFRTLITGARFDDRWTLETTAEKITIEYDALILAMPGHQAIRILGEQDRLVGLEMPSFASCWATVAILDHPLNPGFSGAFVNSGPLGWISLNHTKPDRAAASTIVLHATDEWSQRHHTADPDWVSSLLLESGRQIIDGLPQAFISRSFYWRNARAREPLSVGAVAHHDRPVVLCGDWCNGNRIEGALLSGMAAAALVLNTL